MSIRETTKKTARGTVYVCGDMAKRTLFYSRFIFRISQIFKDGGCFKNLFPKIKSIALIVPEIFRKNCIFYIFERIKKIPHGFAQAIFSCVTFLSPYESKE